MSKVWVFQQSTLEAAPSDWVDKQIAAYPHKEELIRTVELAILDFLDSPDVEARTMVMRPGSARPPGDESTLLAASAKGTHDPACINPARSPNEQAARASATPR